MTPIPGKLYRTITELPTWQFSAAFSSSFADRDDDTCWNIKQIVGSGVVVMLVRTLPRYDLGDDSPGCIYELVGQNGVLMRAYLSDIRNHKMFFEEVKP